MDDKRLLVNGLSAGAVRELMSEFPGALHRIEGRPAGGTRLGGMADEVLVIAVLSMPLIRAIARRIARQKVTLVQVETRADGSNQIRVLEVDSLADLPSDDDAAMEQLLQRIQGASRAEGM